MSVRGETCAVEAITVMRQDALAVLVIGGTGFIGSAVVRALKAAGCNVIASSKSLVTSFEDGSRISLDVLDREALMSATSEVDCVINCFRESQSEDESAAAVANILHCCAVNGVEKLIHLSSVAVYGAAEGLVDEWTPPVPPLNWYGKAKSRAERACHAKANPSLHIAVLRPSLVYGPGGEEWFTRFLRSIEAGRLGELGPGGEGYANLIYVDDLADMCSHLVLSPIPEFSIVIANGSERVTFNSYFQEIRRAIGPENQRAGFYLSRARGPVAASRRLGRATIKLARHFTRVFVRNEILLDRLFGKIELVVRSRPEDEVKRNYSAKTFYASRSAQAMGLYATTPLRQGVAASVNWAKQANII